MYQQIAHPDIVGPSASALAVILNASYETLMDADLRAAYDIDLQYFIRDGLGGFDGRAVSAWLGPEEETRAVFVVRGS